jgi:hypothetical protein
MSKLSQSILDLPDTKIQEVISDKLKDLYNSNYIYFLHCQYKGPTQIEKRNQLFEDFIRCQTERSLKKLILDSRREPNPTIDNRCYVAFSLAEPYSTDLRDLVDNDEDLKGHKFNIAIVEYTSYNSLSVKREQIQKIVKDPLHHTIIFQFKHSEEWSNLEEHVSIVSEVLKEITSKKLIILLAHNSSFDENEKKKFKFPSITFHSQFEPISLDILDFKNNDFRAYYELLDKTPFQVLTDPNIGFLEVKLGELLRQEFVYGKPYPQRFSQIDSMVDFIRSKRLMRRIFIHIISQTQEEILLDTQDQSLDVHQPLVDIIRAMGSEVIDIVEMMDKNIIPLVYSVLQCAVRAVHQRCDLFFALRLFAKIEEKKRLSQSTEQLEILMTLWERVALKTSLSLKNRERNCGRIIYTDKDSRENPQIFYLNFLQSIQSLQSELIPLELKQRTVTKFKKRLQMAGCKLLTQELGSTLYKVIKNDVYLYLKDRINLDPSVWTQDIEYLNTEGELSHMVLNGILSSTTSWRRNTYRFNLDDLLMFAEPLVAHFKRENGHLLMQDKVILYCVVLECFPDEIEEYVKLGHEPELALRLIEDMQELKIAKLREANERNSIESLAEQIIGKKIKADREAIGFMAQLLVDDGGSLIKAKFGLAKSTLTQLYTDIFGNQEFKDDLQAKLGVAVNYLDFLIELRFVHHGFSAEEKWKFEGEWLTLMINLMSQANLTVLQKVAIINQEENIYETTMIHCPARILAQLISDADATRLELKDGKLILESPISSFDTSGGITSLHFEDKSRFL